MIDIPKRRPSAKSRRQEEQETVDAILFALNSMRGVWAAQNKVKTLPILAGGWLNTGLGKGSADIVFSTAEISLDGSYCSTARIGWLECKTLKTKTTTKTHAARDEHQRIWAVVMRKKGHFVADGIVSVRDAVDAVERCKRGESQ